MAQLPQILIKPIGIKSILYLSNLGKDHGDFVSRLIKGTFYFYNNISEIEIEVAIHDDCFVFQHSMNPKFVSYCFQTQRFNAEKNKFVARAKVKRLSGESLAKLTIPVPPLEEQERIVAILDKFDALVNDMSFGLPAEIKARRQQYTQYRDRLLTFREAA